MQKRGRALLIVCAAAAAGIALVLALPRAQDQILYNHTPSVPVGLYVRSQAAPARGAFVTVRALAVAPEAARARGFDGPRNRFLKRVAAEAGDRVCAEGETLRINDGAPLVRRTHDSLGAPLAAWSGCRVLGADEYLLLGDTPDSFDGRYWGPTPRNRIEGVWRPAFGS